MASTPAHRSNWNAMDELGAVTTRYPSKSNDQRGFPLEDGGIRFKLVTDPWCTETYFIVSPSRFGDREFAADHGVYGA